MDSGELIPGLAAMNGGIAPPLFPASMIIINTLVVVSLFVCLYGLLKGKKSELHQSASNFLAVPFIALATWLAADVLLLFKPWYLVKLIAGFFTTISFSALAFRLLLSPKTQPPAGNEHSADQQEMIKSIADSSPDVLYVFDLQSNNIIYINQALPKILGFTQSQLLAMKDQVMTELIHPQDLPLVYHNMAKYPTMPDFEVIEFDLRVKDASGRWRWINASQKSFRRNVQGQVVQVVGIAKDVTEKKETDEKIRTYQKFIQKLNAASPNIIYVLDIVNLRHIYTNRNIFEKIGYNAADINENEDPFTRLLHPDDLNKCLEHLNDFRNAAENEVRSIEYRIRDGQGNYRWIYSQEAVFERDENNQVTQLVGIASDISDRKKMEEELRELNVRLEEKVNERTLELQENQEKLKQSEALLKLITNTIPAYVSYLNKNETMVFANDRYLNLASSRGPVSGNYLHEAFGVENYKKCRQVFIRAAKGESVSCQIKIPMSSGKQKYIGLNYVPDIDENNRVKGLVVLGIDLTQRVEYENNLRFKNAELKRINKELDHFIYATSHDLKTPISNMEGLLNSIYEEIQSSCKNEIALMFGMIQKSITRLKGSISDLADISEVQNYQKDEIELVDILSLIEEFKSDFSKEIAESGAVIETKLEVAGIQFSKKNLRSLLYNLLSNSIKCRKPGLHPIIRVKSTHLRPGCTLLTIADNGLGMDSTSREKIFGMFRHLHNHLEDSGIGLYIVKKIIENAGGKITVHSRVGKGTTFKLYLGE